MCHKRINTHVELCTDRRVSITCQQLNKRKSKLLTERETWHSLGDDTEKVILVRLDNSLGSGICYATGHHCCTVHNTEEVVLGKCVDTQQKTCAMAAIHSIRKSLQDFLENIYFSQYRLKEPFTEQVGLVS